MGQGGWDGGARCGTSHNNTTTNSKNNEMILIEENRAGQNGGGIAIEITATSEILQVFKQRMVDVLKFPGEEGS